MLYEKRVYSCVSSQFYKAESLGVGPLNLQFNKRPPPPDPHRPDSYAWSNLGTIALENGEGETARVIEVKQELAWEEGGNGGKESTGHWHLLWSFLSSDRSDHGQGATTGPRHLPHTHGSDLAPVLRISELRLQVFIGFSVLHYKASNKLDLVLSMEDKKKCFL